MRSARCAAARWVHWGRPSRLSRALRSIRQGTSTRPARLCWKLPLKDADAILRPPGLDGGAAKALCAQFAQVTDKFPFNAQSKTPASFAEVNALFQPASGAIWTFYEQQLKSLLLRQGSEYVVNPSSGAKVSPGFLRFFNHAVQFSETVYPGGSPTPQLHFTLHPYPVQGMQELTFDMNGQTLPASGSPKQFTWTGGDMGQVRVTGSMGGAELGILSYSGTLGNIPVLLRGGSLAELRFHQHRRMGSEERTERPAHDDRRQTTDASLRS